MLRTDATFFDAAKESVPSNGTTKRNRYCDPVQGLRHRHYCIGAERMSNEDNRSAVAPTIARGNFAYDCVRFGVIVNARFDAMPGDQHRQLIHAERKNVHQATHQVNMGEAHRLVSILRGSPRRGGGSTGSADNGIGTNDNEATNRPIARAIWRVLGSNWLLAE
jgi:hypothetical protein